MSQARWCVMNHVRPWWTIMVDQLNDTYERDTIERKHNIRGLPFDTINMIDQILDKGTETELMYLIVQYAIQRGLIHEISTDVDNVEEFVRMARVQEIIEIITRLPVEDIRPYQSTKRKFTSTIEADGDRVIKRKREG